MQQLNAVCFEQAIRALDTLLSLYIMNSCYYQLDFMSLLLMASISMLLAIGH